MSTTLYASEQRSAAASLKRAGSVVSFFRPFQSYNDTDGSIGGSSVTADSYAITTKGNPVRLAALNVTLVQPLTLLIAALPLGAFVPLPDDRMTYAGVVYTVKDVDWVAPDGPAILYRVTGDGGAPGQPAPVVHSLAFSSDFA